MTRVRLISSCVLLLLVASALPAQGQDRPVVFFHGLGSKPETWIEAAARLQTDLAIQPHIPNTDASAPFGVQAANAHHAVGSLDTSAIAVGHSNGGVVARLWNQLHPLSGIVTLGTPHRGAPLLSNMIAYTNFGWTVMDAASAVYGGFNANCCSWQWMIWELADWMFSTVGFLQHSLLQTAVELGLYVAQPIYEDMQVGSSFMQSLNSPGNIAREATEAGPRVGLVSVAHNFYWGGPVRAMKPEAADAFVVVREVTRYLLYVYASYLFTTAPTEEIFGWDLAHLMMNAAGLLGFMDEWWCRAVSDPHFAACWANDTVVPVWSQDYGALGAHVGVMPDGPVHIRQTHQSDEALRWALTTYMNVSAREVAPPPTPDPPPASPDPPPASAGDTLWAESGLYRGESLVSSDGRFHLDYQYDGNLVLYDEWGNALWWSGTSGAPGAAWMRADGNFHIYDGNGDLVWQSGTQGDLGNWCLRLENNGTLYIYTPDGTPVWSNY